MRRLSLDKAFSRTIASVFAFVFFYLLAYGYHSRPQFTWLQDDAYISFRYAKNLVQGNGLVYNAGDRVEGYTNFLWTMISAVPIARGEIDPAPFMESVSRVLWVANYAAWLVFGIILAVKYGLHRPYSLAALPLLFHYSYNAWFSSGMETPLVCFLFTLLAISFAVIPRWPTLGYLLINFFATLIAMTRSDGMLLFVVTAGITAVSMLTKRGENLRDRLRSLLIALSPIYLIFVPFTLWRVWYYGQFFPNTYYAKVAYLSFYERGWSYVRKYFHVYPFWWLLPAIPLAISAKPPAPIRMFLTGSLLIGLLQFLYVLRLGGDHMEWRFVMPPTGVLVAATSVAFIELSVMLVRSLAGRVAHSTRATAVANIVSSTIALGMIVLLTSIIAGGINRVHSTRMPGGETINELRSYCDPADYHWQHVGRMLREHIPRDAYLAGTAAGAVPFFAEHRFLDTHGLTDRVIGMEPIAPDRRQRVGHEHWLTDLNVMRQRGVDVFLTWPDNKRVPTAATTAPSPGQEMFSLHLGNGRYFDFVLLSGNRALRDRFISDPAITYYRGDGSR